MKFSLDKNYSRIFRCLRIFIFIRKYCVRNDSAEIQNNFTLGAMRETVEWIDQHGRYKLAYTVEKFRKLKYMHRIPMLREYIRTNGKRLEKLEKIKEST